MLSVVLVAGIVVLWQMPLDDTDFEVIPADDLLRVYGLREESPTEAILLPPVDSDIRGTIRALAETLSDRTFGGLPIHVVGVESLDGDLRAFVDLTEPEPRALASWEGTYFQGSALAGQTKRALLWSFLQPEYEGLWIDSVSFYYQGKPFDPRDHIDLSPVFGRQELSSETVSSSPGG
jgi:hypothetical protein